MNPELEYIKPVASLADLFAMRQMTSLVHNQVRESFFRGTIGKASGLQNAFFYESAARGKNWVVIQHQDVLNGANLSKTKGMIRAGI